MTGHRRYGTTSKSTAAAARLPTQSAATDKQKPIPLLTGERREIRVPSTDDDGERGGGGRHSSEREPLLLDLQGPVEGNGRGGSSGGGGPGVGTRAAFSAGSSRRDNGRVLTALLILNYMIGSGILNAPQVHDNIIIIDMMDPAVRSTVFVLVFSSSQFLLARGRLMLYAPALLAAALLLCARLFGVCSIDGRESKHTALV